MAHLAKNFLFAFLILSLGSCEKDFIPNTDEGTKKMVVECMLDNQHLIKVFVTESSSPAGNYQLHYIADAIVELYMNDSLLQTLPFTYVDSAHTFGAYVYN